MAGRAGGTHRSTALEVSLGFRVARGQKKHRRGFDLSSPIGVSDECQDVRAHIDEQSRGPRRRSVDPSIQAKSSGDSNCREAVYEAAEPFRNLSQRRWWACRTTNLLGTLLSAKGEPPLPGVGGVPQTLWAGGGKVTQRSPKAGIQGAWVRQGTPVLSPVCGGESCQSSPPSTRPLRNARRDGFGRNGEAGRRERLSGPAGTPPLPPVGPPLSGPCGPSTPSPDAPRPRRSRGKHEPVRPPQVVRHALEQQLRRVPPQSHVPHPPVAV